MAPGQDRHVPGEGLQGVRPHRLQRASCGVRADGRRRGGKAPHPDARADGGDRCRRGVQRHAHAQAGRHRQSHQGPHRHATGTRRMNFTNPYAWPRKPLLAANAVATSQPLAAQAGLQMLAEGGSAVDAIVATAITLTLVEPVSNGIGSDAYAIVWDGKQLHGLNASGRSPAAWSLDYFRGQKTVPVRGWNSVSVPGCVSAWLELHRRFGRLPFERLFERAIRYGREGFLVSPTIAGQWAKQVAELKEQPGFAEAFLPGGRAPAPGERFTWPAHAEALEQIARTRGDVFYRGALAERIEAHA